MAPLLDLDRLDHLTTRLDADAEELRQRGGQLEARAEAMAWQSPAAESCRQQVRGLAARLRGAADGLAAAAGALRLHIGVVRSVTASLAIAAQAGEAAATGVAAAGRGVLHAIGL
jgi:hypothetical protein